MKMWVSDFSSADCWLAKFKNESRDFERTVPPSSGRYSFFCPVPILVELPAESRIRMKSVVVVRSVVIIIRVVIVISVVIILVIEFIVGVV